MATLLAILNSQLDSLNSGPIAVEVVQDLDERVLREVLGQLAVADHPIDERKDWSLISAD